MIIIFLLPQLISGIVLYDNTEQMSPKDPPPNQLEPCISQTTEHFTKKNADFDEGQLSLHSSRLIKEIVTHLLYLMPIERPIYYSDSQQQFITYVSFQNSFQYSPMAIPAHYLRACHHFLFIKKQGSSLCKNSTHIKFNLEDCAAMLQDLVEARIPHTAKTLEPLAEGIVFHTTEQLGGPILFHDVNDENVKPYIRG